MKYTKKDIHDMCEKGNVKFIRLQFTDILGNQKNVAINVSQIDNALDNKIMFDGSSVKGFTRINESDMFLYPDLDTFVILPFDNHNGNVARIICDVYMPDGKPFEGDPRYILKKTIKEAEEFGFQLDLGPEAEFFLFELDEMGRATTITNDEGDYFDLGPIDNGELARQEMSLILEKMGFEIEAAHHEAAKGQHEIDFKYGEALLTADRIMTFKGVVKSVAKKNNLYATFMPKPIRGINGSGMHMNMSLSKDGKNAFYDEKDSLGLSKICYNFKAGIIKYIKEMTAITNPLVNSYKRLIPGYEAPCYIAWSAKNRSPLIRIPSTRGEGTRVELRSPDPSANPYLAIAVCLKAGLEGIKNNLYSDLEVNDNIFNLSKEQKSEQNIESLPSNLLEAIRYMENSDFMKDVLGEHTHSIYIKSKLIEWDNYEMDITKWELDNYLNKY